MNFRRTLIILFAAISLLALSAGYICQNDSALKFPTTNIEPKLESHQKNSTSLQQRLITENDRYIDADESDLHQPTMNKELQSAALLPVAMQRDDSASVLPPEQSKAVEAVRAKFELAMQGAGNPSSIKYLQRWNQEQEKADQLLIVYLGQDGYNKLHVPQP